MGSTMEAMASQPKFAPYRHWWPSIAVVITTVYVPYSVAYFLGSSHCEVCREAWFAAFWIGQGFIIQKWTQVFLHLPQSDGRGAWLTCLLVQFVWIAGWVWLAQRGRGWLVGVVVVAGALSSLAAFWTYALIRA